MHHAEHYPNIVAFIAGIGLPIVEATLPDNTFLPGIALHAGGLIVDPEKLLWPGDLLHEAGHLAVLPEAMRVSANDDLVDTTNVAHAGEIEAMAWAYAAAIAIAVPLDVLIHEGGYKGRSLDVLSMYGYGIYPGLRGLCETGMAASAGFAATSAAVQYPQMLKWLRD